MYAEYKHSILKFLKAFPEPHELLGVWRGGGEGSSYSPHRMRIGLDHQLTARTKNSWLIVCRFHGNKFQSSFGRPSLIFDIRNLY